MDVLVMGGTRFLSRAVAEIALAAGHRVTMFNRGRSGPGAEAAEQVTGDRDESRDLAQLAGRTFDLVFDTSYYPYQVKTLAALLEPTARHFVFVSTLNVYPGWPQRLDYHADGVYDGDPDVAGSLVPPWFGSGSGPYGWRKVGAERAALRAFGPERTTVLRAGVLVGPWDVMGRLPWWIDRIGRGGEVLCPGDPDAPLTVLDARDLAAFALHGVPGTFEATGALAGATRRDVFEQIRASTGSAAEFTWVGDEWLAAQEVTPFSEISLWFPPATAPSLFGLHTETARQAAEDARAAGLAPRPLAETVDDIWSWMRGVPGGWQPARDVPGLAPAKEGELLAAWHRRSV
jgi:2'-hydroxyisoflavone reductase